LPRLAEASRGCLPLVQANQRPIRATSKIRSQPGRFQSEENRAWGWCGPGWCRRWRVASRFFEAGGDRLQRRDPGVVVGLFPVGLVGPGLLPPGQIVPRRADGCCFHLFLPQPPARHGPLFPPVDGAGHMAETVNLWSLCHYRARFLPRPRRRSLLVCAHFLSEPDPTYTTAPRSFFCSCPVRRPRAPLGRSSWSRVVTLTAPGPGRRTA